MSRIADEEHARGGIVIGHRAKARSRVRRDVGLVPRVLEHIRPHRCRIGSRRQQPVGRVSAYRANVGARDGAPGIDFVVTREANDQAPAAEGDARAEAIRRVVRRIEIGRRSRRPVGDQLAGVVHLDPPRPVEVVLAAQSQHLSGSDIAIHRLLLALGYGEGVGRQHLGAMRHRYRAGTCRERMLLVASRPSPACTGARAGIRQPVERVSGALVERRPVVSRRADRDVVAVDGDNRSEKVAGFAFEQRFGFGQSAVGGESRHARPGSAAALEDEGAALVPDLQPLGRIAVVLYAEVEADHGRIDVLIDLAAIAQCRAVGIRHQDQRAGLHGLGSRVRREVAFRAVPQRRADHDAA